MSDIVTTRINRRWPITRANLRLFWRWLNDGTHTSLAEYKLRELKKIPGLKPSQVLIKAHEMQVPQITGALRDDNAYCAVGVLMSYCNGMPKDAQVQPSTEQQRQLMEWFNGLLVSGNSLAGYGTRYVENMNDENHLSFADIGYRLAGRGL